ncbi:hypothetical protein [Paenibacillus mesophilus]|nr:hypothetical protein [Paenibacillus mesophilus]
MLNYAASAVGLIQVEVIDETGRIAEGMSFDDMDPCTGIPCTKR